MKLGLRIRGGVYGLWLECRVIIMFRGRRVKSRD